MGANALTVPLLVVFAIVIAIECAVLGPNPKPIYERPMEWRDEYKRDKNGELIYTPDGNHFVTEKKWVPKEYDPKRDGCPAWQHPTRDLVFLFLVGLSFLGGISCYLTLIIGVWLLAWSGVFPPDVPATTNCLGMSGVLILGIVGGIWALMNRQ
jgi:hypothetical protein